MRRLLFLALLAAFVLEPTAGSRLYWLGGRPLLVLGIVIYYALVRGAPAGTLFGLILGFVADLLALGYPGIRMLGYSVVGFTVGNTWDSVYKDNGWTQAVILFLAVLLYETIVFLVITGLDLGSFFPFTLRHAVPTALLTAAAFPLALAAFERLTRREISFDARRVVIRRRR